MRERYRKHDDVHYPLGGRGKRHRLPKGRRLGRDGAELVTVVNETCAGCGFVKGGNGCRASCEGGSDK